MLPLNIKCAKIKELTHNTQYLFSDEESNMASVGLVKIIEKMKLENLTPDIEVKNIRISQPDINRPALQMAGYFEHFDATRLQIVGFVEYTYMEGLSEERKREIYEKLLSYDMPAIVFCRELEPDSIFGNGNQA